MKPPNDERLMRYFDRELEGAEADEIEQWLAESEEARTLLLHLERVGDTVREIGADMGAGSAGIADAVMARLAEAESSAPKPLQSPARGGGAETRAARRWFAAVPAVGLAFAAAAAIVFYFRPHPRPLVNGVVPAVTVSSAGSIAPEPAASEPPPSVAADAASIESLDYGAVAGTIFMVPGDPSSEETQTPVVWLKDEPAPDEGRMAPL